MKRIVGLAAAALLASVVAASAQDSGGPSLDTGVSVEAGTVITAQKAKNLARSQKTQAMKAARAARAAKASAAVDDSSTSHPDTGVSVEAGAGAPNVLRANARRPRG